MLIELAAACKQWIADYAIMPFWQTYPVTIAGREVYVMRGIDNDEDEYVNFLFTIALPPEVYVLAGDDDTYGSIEGLRIYV